MRLQRQVRTGATVVECAIVYPATFLLVLGLIVGGLGIFRYQEMSSLARRAARYASVHGTEYARTMRTTPPTPEQIYNEAIKPYAISLDPNRLTYTVTYDRENAPATPDIKAGDVVLRGNTVKVTVSYFWVPEAFLGGVTLSSTSVMPMSY